MDFLVSSHNFYNDNAKNIVTGFYLLIMVDNKILDKSFDCSQS